MIILGLGSNLGDRLAHLREAYAAIQSISGLNIQQVSPIYISDALLPANAPADWNKPYLNLAIRCEATCTPFDLLDQIKKIECDIGREKNPLHWSPRAIDIDLLAWDDLVLSSEQLSIPRESLLDRPFQLWPLADVAPCWVYPLPGASQGKTAEEIAETWGSRFSGNAPFRTKQIYQRIDTPQLIGVVNVTPDSFSDGGLFLETDKAVQQALSLVYAGADIIDIGAESTAPHAKSLDAKIEWARLEPVLTALAAEKKRFLIPPKISIDTRHAEVAANALAFDIDWINDVTGFDDQAMQQVAANSKTDCVIMHHLSIPASRQHVLPRHQNPLTLIYEWAEKRLATLEKAGIARNRMIFDPGIGFGKVAEHSLALIKHINDFKKLGVRLLVGHSRKSLFSLFTHHDFSERDIETVTSAVYLANQSVDYLRVHNVEMCARAFKVMRAL